MKSRPRSIERRVAEELSAIFELIGYKAVKRIPVLGRTGPDIDINEMGIVIDVKSRHAVPSICMANDFELFNNGYLVGFQLSDIGNLENLTVTRRWKSSTVVERWLRHMDEWTVTNQNDGISMIILHRPRMSVSSSTCIIHPMDLERLKKRWKPIKH